MNFGFNNGVFDSRDVDSVIEELIAEIALDNDVDEDLVEQMAVDYQGLDEDAFTDDQSRKVFADENLATLANLMEFRTEVCLYDGGEWQYGTTLIPDSAFTDYAQEMAEDIGAVDDNAHWPNRHIDWEAAADELKQDYTSSELDGQTVWYRVG